MYLWSALVSGCALAIAFIDGRVLVSAIVSVALVVAVVLPRLVRSPSPSGSDQRSGEAGTAPRHRRHRGRRTPVLVAAGSMGPDPRPEPPAAGSNGSEVASTPATAGEEPPAEPARDAS
jgi:hypothetical protein